MCAEAKNMITKAFRRRGKKLVQAAHIASTNEHGELFRVSVKRDTPFRSATSDVGQVWSRSNHNFKFMPRFLDLEVLHELDVELSIVRAFQLGRKINFVPRPTVSKSHGGAAW